MIMFKAKSDDIDKIEKLYNDSIKLLNGKKIYQWDHQYPNREIFKECIFHKEQFLFKDNELLIGSVILNEYQAKEWDLINWKYMDCKKLSIHALVIHSLLQGKGYGSMVLKMCEQYARENHYHVIRLDVFTENPIAIRLYEKNGYEKVGEVSFDCKPEGHQNYYCYEKEIMKQ